MRTFILILMRKAIVTMRKQTEIYLDRSITFMTQNNLGRYLI